MMIRNCLLAIAYLCFTTIAIDARRSVDAAFQEGLFCFQQRYYPMAQQQMEWYLAGSCKQYQKETASYYSIRSAIENKDPHVEAQLQYFVAAYPRSCYIATLRYHLAKLHVEQGAWDKSLSLLQTINAMQLTPCDRVQLPYTRGCVYWQLKDGFYANRCFAQIKDKNYALYYPARLRMAAIAFEQGAYQDAHTILQEFHNNKDHLDQTTSLTLQLYHKTGDFNSLLTYANSCALCSFTRQDRLLLADGYFFLEQYREAVGHYQYYLEDNAYDSATLLKLAHALYTLQDNRQAMSCLQQLSAKRDRIGQVASYYIGLLYEREDNSQAAAAAFIQAAQQPFDQELAASATMKHAAICYQQGAIQDTVQIIEKFIAEDTFSKHRATAQTLLIQCYDQMQAYEKVIDYIASLPDKNEMVMKIYQSALLCQALVHYNNHNLQETVAYCKQSLHFPLESTLVAQAQFWLAEAYIGLSSYNKALKYYSKLLQPGNVNMPYYENILYGIAYAHFNMEHYHDAAQYFEQYIALTQKYPAAAHYDALLRLGDCYYVTKDYQQALHTYPRVYAYYPAHVRYREGLIYSLLGDHTHAEAALQEVIDHHSETPYYEKALYQQAITLFNTGHYLVAAQKITHLLEKKPDDKALHLDLLMKRALAYENLRQYSAAAIDYMAILEQHPTHVYAENAYIALSNLSVQPGMPSNLASCLQKHAHLTKSSHSDAYAMDRAKQFFYSQAYHTVIEQLAAFLTRYPQSPLIAECHFLMAESYYRLQKNHQALFFYKKIENNDQTPFQCKTWLRMADIAYQGKQYSEALRYYQRLKKRSLDHKAYGHTMMGIIQSSFLLKRYQVTTPACLELLNNTREKKEVALEQQARLYLGKIAMQRLEYAHAKGHFFKARMLAHTAAAAEAQYLLAYTMFKLKDYSSSLNTLFELIEKYPAHTAYLEDAFLLMADNYMMLDNLHQAKATLDSIISKSKNNKIVALAKQKKATIMAQLKRSSAKPIPK